MANDITIPFAGQKPAQAFQTALPPAQDESLSEGIGSSYGVIGYKGKNWSLRYRGERHMFTRSDDGSPLSYIDVIILRAAKHKSKSYYPEGYSPEASEGKPPTCSSMDGVVPDQGVVAQQSNACAICPRNVWKPNTTTGRNERECTDYKRLAVLLVPGLSKQVLGQPLIEPVFLRIPPASLGDLALFGDTMAGQGWHFSSFVTRISFDPELAHPKMVFRPLQALTDAESPVILEQRDSPLAKRITGEDIPPAGLPAPGPAQTLGLTQAPIQSAAAPAPVQGSQHVAHRASDVVAQAEPPTTVLTPEPVDTTKAEPAPGALGFLELTANKPAPVTAGGNGAANPADLRVADTGEPSESDAALDAKLEGLLKTSG